MNAVIACPPNGVQPHVLDLPPLTIRAGKDTVPHLAQCSHGRSFDRYRQGSPSAILTIGTFTRIR
ncbi:hypothetical protein PCAR4_60280 [Paraburkholderia caribensis]|nr:hypothetical protein PCAR4_60280 [Paraburkholderia caribensis]